MSSSLVSRSGFHNPRDTLRAAPEGLPAFRKLLDQSAKIAAQLHNPQFTYLKDLEKTWDRLEYTLEEVCVALKTMMAYTDLEDVRIDDLLGELPTAVFEHIFLLKPEEQSSKATGTEKLREAYQEAIDRVPSPHSTRIVADLKTFWDLWLPAREEVTANGPAVEARYEPFSLCNSMLDTGNSELEHERFGSSLFPEGDARTIAGLIDLRPVPVHSFESRTVDKLVSIVKRRAAQGHDLDKPAAESENEESVLSERFSVAGATGISPSEDSGLPGLDVSLLSGHLTPRVRDISPQLGRSLRNGYQLLVTETADRRREKDFWRVENISNMARLVKAVEEAITHHDESSINPEMTIPSTFASSGA